MFNWIIVSRFFIVSTWVQKNIFIFRIFIFIMIQVYYKWLSRKRFEQYYSYLWTIFFPIPMELLETADLWMARVYLGQESRRFYSWLMFSVIFIMMTLRLYFESIKYGSRHTEIIFYTIFFVLFRLIYYDIDRERITP